MTISASHQIIFNLLPQTAKENLQILDWKNGVSLICLKKGIYKQKNTSSLNLENFFSYVTQNICTSVKSLREVNPIFSDFPFCIRRTSYNKAPGLYIYLGTANIEKHIKEATALFKAAQLNEKLNQAISNKEDASDNT